MVKIEVLINDDDDKISVEIHAGGWGNIVEEKLASLLCDTIDITSKKYIDNVYN